MTAAQRRRQRECPVIMPVDPKTIAKGDIVSLGTTEKDTRKGQNVSGRSWKVRPQKRASTIYKTKTNNMVQSWESRQADRLVRKESRELEQELKESKKQERLAKKERRLEQEKRRADNEYNNAQKSMQKLNHSKLSSTLKRMSKKQLRQVKKTRLNTKTGAVELVSAYAK